MASHFNYCPTFHQRYHNAAVHPPPPPDHLTFHNLSDINPLLFQSSTNQFSTFNNNNFTTNLPFPNTIKYPNLQSSYINPFLTLQQDQQLLHTPITPFSYPTDEFSSYINDECCYQYPLIPNVWPNMEPPEVLSLPELYQGGGGGEVKKQMINGLSAQSVAARVRRRKISEKTLELGKLIPGGHRMNTAEMFQAAFKYVKFLQAQIAVLQLIPHESQEPIGELQALVTCPSVQEKLYAVEKCIVTQTLAKTLANDQGIKKNKMDRC